MRPASAAIAAMVLPLLVSGCGDWCDAACPPTGCPPPFALTVTDDATGQPAPDVSASSPGLVCTGGDGVAWCDAAAAGTHDVVLSAPGYVTQRVSVRVEPPVVSGVCECPRCRTWQPASVALAPAG